MLSKIYLAALGLSFVVMAFFTYYSWSWLQSITQPAVAAAGYEYHAGLAWLVLWISASVLLLLGNAVLWVTGRSWAMWTSFAYFAVFIVVKFFWLDRAFFEFQKEKDLTDSGLSAGPIFAVILIALMAAVVFFDQFIVVRLHQKTYPPESAADPVIPAEPVAE